MILLNHIANMKYFGQAISKLQQLLYSKWCPSLPWVLLPPVTSQAGHIKRKYGPFYSLEDIENGRIQQFCNILTLLSSKLHIEGVVLNLGILHVTSQPPSPALLLGKEYNKEYQEGFPRGFLLTAAVDCHRTRRVR